MSVEIEHASAEDVRKAAAEAVEQHVSRSEREALDRLTQGVGAGGRGVAGLQSTLDALNESRVEILMLAPATRPPASATRGAAYSPPRTSPTARPRRSRT